MQDAVCSQANQSAAAYLSATKEHGGGGSAAKDKQRRVLIIEDDLDNGRLLAYLLRMSGYQVEYAINGIVGLEIAQRFLPHVVVLDLRLPDTHGAEIIRQLRRHPELRGARIVAVTGSTTPDDLNRAASAGADHLLTKPVTVRTYEQLINATPIG